MREMRCSIPDTRLPERDGRTSGKDLSKAWARWAPATLISERLRSFDSRMKHLRITSLSAGSFRIGANFRSGNLRGGVANVVLLIEEPQGNGAANQSLRKLCMEKDCRSSRERQSGYQPVISMRSGDTEEDFDADLVVPTGTSLIKIGTITRSERFPNTTRCIGL